MSATRGRRGRSRGRAANGTWRARRCGCLCSREKAPRPPSARKPEGAGPAAVGPEVGALCWGAKGSRTRGGVRAPQCPTRPPAWVGAYASALSSTPSPLGQRVRARLIPTSRRIRATGRKERRPPERQKRSGVGPTAAGSLPPSRQTKGLAEYRPGAV